jgi:hypothetical protein
VAPSVAYLSVVVLGALTAADAAIPMTTVQPHCRVDAGRVTVSTSMSTPEPLIVLFERNPWLMSVGSDFPAVVVYEDGRTLYVEGDGRKTKVMSGHIDSRAAVSLRDELVVDGFLNVAADTTCSDKTDQITVEILVRRGVSWKMTSAYGIGRDGDCKVRPPKPFVEAYRRLQKLRAAGAKPFEPEEIEVIIWGFEHARSEPIPWPADVPAPPANVVPEEYAPNNPKPYDHVVSAKFRSQIDKLTRAMDSSNPPRAMLLNGHKWTVVPRSLWPGYRLVEDVVRCAYKNRAVRSPRD